MAQLWYFCASKVAIAAETGLLVLFESIQYSCGDRARHRLLLLWRSRLIESSANMRINLSLLPILSIGCWIFGSSAQAKPPTILAEFWALQPTCPGLSFRAYSSGSQTVVDAANGYLEVVGDGPKMAIAMFKQAPGRYIIGVNQIDTMSETSCFLRYTAGKWQDVSSQVVPNYSRRKFYEVPRRGTTVNVFPLIRQDEMDERGSQQGSLLWRNGKFVPKS